MRVFIKEGHDHVNDALEFYLVGLDYFEHFDLVADLMKKDERIKIIEIVEGIYFRILKFDIESNHFKLLYHEDVGIYTFSLSQSDSSNDLLRHVLQSIVENLEAREV